MPKKPNAAPKPTPMPASEASITEELREAQKAYLLLQLLDAEGHTLSKGSANRFRDSVKKSLGFASATVANYRREKLAEQKYLSITRQGRSVEYVLLPDGKDYLAVCIRHLDHIELRVKGKTLNALIAAARETSFGAAPATTPTQPEARLPVTAQLADAVLAEFDAPTCVPCAISSIS
jgi:hypothetical protein